jgi:hypothetical protein
VPLDAAHPPDPDAPVSGEEGGAPLLEETDQKHNPRAPWPGPGQSLAAAPTPSPQPGPEPSSSTTRRRTCEFEDKPEAAAGVATVQPEVEPPARSARERFSTREPEPDARPKDDTPRDEAGQVSIDHMAELALEGIGALYKGAGEEPEPYRVQKALELAARRVMSRSWWGIREPSFRGRLRRPSRKPRRREHRARPAGRDGGHPRRGLVGSSGGGADDKRPTALSEDEFDATVRALLADAVQWTDKTWRQARVGGWQTYNAEVEQTTRAAPPADGDTTVSYEVSDAVQQVMPDLMEQLAGGDEPVEYYSHDPQKHDLCRQATLMALALFWEGGGWQGVHDAALHAAVGRLGFLKVFREEKLCFEDHDFQGLTPDVVSAMAQQPGHLLLETEDEYEEDMNGMPYLARRSGAGAALLRRGQDQGRGARSGHHVRHAVRGSRGRALRRAEDHAAHGQPAGDGVRGGRAGGDRRPRGRAAAQRAQRRAPASRSRARRTTAPGRCGRWTCTRPIAGSTPTATGCSSCGR